MLNAMFRRQKFRLRLRIIITALVLLTFLTLLCINLHRKGKAMASYHIDDHPRITVDIIKLQLRPRVKCELCILPTFCQSQSNDGTPLALPASSKTIISGLARSRRCHLKEQNDSIALMLHPVVWMNEAEAELTNFEKIDVLDISLAVKSNIEKRNNLLHHFPHYLEMVMLQVIRSVSFFERDILKLMHSSMTKLKPTLLVQEVKSSHNRWIYGLHKALLVAFPFVRVTQVRKGREKTCYRSAIVSTCSKITPTTHIFQERFAKNYNGRRGRRHTRLKIGILSRKDTRKLLETEKLKQTISSSFLETGVSVDIQVLFFERKSFLQQARSVMNLDVLIASHGAGNSNIVFMKHSSLFIEVLPFGHDGNFMRLSKYAGLHYAQLVAFPDETSVEKCKESEGLKHDQMFFLLWRKAVMGNATKAEGKALQENVHRRACLRTQQLAVSADAVVELIVKDTLQRQSS